MERKGAGNGRKDSEWDGKMGGKATELCFAWPPPNKILDLPLDVMYYM